MRADDDRIDGMRFGSLADLDGRISGDDPNGTWRDANRGGWEGLLPHFLTACTACTGTTPRTHPSWSAKSAPPSSATSPATSTKDGTLEAWARAADNPVIRGVVTSDAVLDLDQRRSPPPR